MLKRLWNKIFKKQNTNLKVWEACDLLREGGFQKLILQNVKEPQTVYLVMHPTDERPEFVRSIKRTFDGRNILIVANKRSDIFKND